MVRKYTKLCLLNKVKALIHKCTNISTSSVPEIKVMLWDEHVFPALNQT